MLIGSSREIEPTIERQGKQRRKRQPRADLLISGHILFTFAFIWHSQFSIQHFQLSGGENPLAFLPLFQCSRPERVLPDREWKVRDGALRIVR
jgi:hypothetical protein